MNCRPNELAIVVKDAHNLGFLGKILTTLYLAPKGVEFDLPDGWGSVRIDTETPHWVCEFPRKVTAPLVSCGSRKTRYMVVPDSCLRPIRGDEQSDGDESKQPLALKGGAA